ncbi:MAG: glycosyltransferase [Gammaproteobacteria bacterium]|nr:glycosyltransferase [Gammaproteobacteria bacterium]
MRGLPRVCTPVLLVVPFSLARSEIEHLMHVDGVAGYLFSSDDPPSAANIARITAEGEWLFPAVKARSVVYLGWSRLIRPRRLYEAMLRGMYRVTAIDATGKWQTQLVPPWYVRYLRTRWNQFQVMRQIEKSRSRVMHWPDTKRATVQAAIDGVRAKAGANDNTGPILQVTGSLGAGGAERQLLSTVIGLVERGHDVQAMCLNCGHRDMDFYLARLREHVPVFSLGDIAEMLIRSNSVLADAATKRMQDPRILRLVGALPLTLREPVLITTLTFLVLRPSVVHLWQDATNIIGGFAALLAGVQRIVLAGRSSAPHHFLYHERYLQPMYRLLLDYPEVILLNNSHAGATSYAAWLGIPTSRIAVIHNGIDSSVFQAAPGARERSRAQWGLSGAEPVVGGVLRLSSEKDPLLWLETAARVRERIPQCRFVLYGDGVMQNEVEAQAQALGLDDVLLLPGVTDDVPAAIRGFDLLLLTSRHEGLPNVLIEAQSLGCPVVTTAVGGAAETIDNGKTGWAVSERSAQALAERCCDVLLDDAWRSVAQVSGPEHIDRHFGLERMLADTRRLYGQLPEGE